MVVRWSFVVRWSDRCGQTKSQWWMQKTETNRQVEHRDKTVSQSNKNLCGQPASQCKHANGVHETQWNQFPFNPSRIFFSFLNEKDSDSAGWLEPPDRDHQSKPQMCG